MTVYVDLQLQQ